MLDPIPPPAPWLSAAVQPIADITGLQALPAHIHELLFAFILYTSIQVFVSPVFSAWYWPDVYPKLNRRTQINWDIHIVSMVQAVLINGLALWVITTDPERNSMNPIERIYGYTGACGLVGAMGAGYFLWDLIISVRNVRLFGLGLLAHAVASLCVFSMGSRPYLQYYGSNFILYELSTPFLNIHWFCDKLGLTGSKLQWYNGMLLLASFAGCRLIWGTWQSVRVYQDIWAALQIPAGTSILDAAKNLSSEIPSQILSVKDGQCVLGDATCAAAQAQITKYMNHADHIPRWLAMSTLVSNVVLNSLNFFWFYQMIKSVMSRFQGNTDHDDFNEKSKKAALQAADVLDKKAPEGKAEITEGGKDSETPKTQSGEMAESLASGVDGKAKAAKKRKA